MVDVSAADLIAAALHGRTDGVGPWVEHPTYGRTRRLGVGVEDRHPDGQVVPTLVDPRDTAEPNDAAVNTPGPTVAGMTSPMTTTPSPGAAFVRLADKAVWTFVEVFAAAWLASGSLGLEGAMQWLAAGLAAAGTVIANGSPASVSTTFGVDLLYRLARTYAVSFVGLWSATVAASIDSGASALTASAASAAAWAAIPAAVTFVKGTAAKMLADRGVGNPDTAALLPASVDQSA